MKLYFYGAIIVIFDSLYCRLTTATGKDELNLIGVLNWKWSL